MRKIGVIYQKGKDELIAERMSFSLNDAGYEACCYCLDDDHTIEEAYKEWGNISLVITVNLAGFSYRSSGDNSVYATLDYNSIHYIDRDADDESRLLNGLITITMKFLTDSKERCERMESSYRRLHDISVVTDIGEDIVRIVDELDWRKG